MGNTGGGMMVVGHKKLTWAEKFMWLKLGIGLSIAIFSTVMMAWSGLTAPTEEEAVRSIAYWGVMASIGFVIAAVGICWGCLG